MAGARWALVVDIFEAAEPDFAILTHTFRGRTKAEAEGYHRAHLTTDSFYRGCFNKGRWENIECWAEARWEKL